MTTLDEAAAELHDTMARVRASLARAQAARAAETGAGGFDRLQEDAVGGRLGTRMQQLARHVASGDTSWQAVFDATSPYAGLLRDHLTAMGEQHEAVVRRAIDEDPPTQLS